MKTAKRALIQKRAQYHQTQVKRMSSVVVTLSRLDRLLRQEELTFLGEKGSHHHLLTHYHTKIHPFTTSIPSFPIELDLNDLKFW